MVKVRRRAKFVVIGQTVVEIWQFMAIFNIMSHSFTKSFFDVNDIWHVVRGRWLMHDGMQYDPIQGQGHESFKILNPAIFRSYLLCHLQWELATDHGFLK